MEVKKKRVKNLIYYASSSVNKTSPIIKTHYLISSVIINQVFSLTAAIIT